MADKKEMEETTPRGADWEVVSLTASAYAAAPGPVATEFKDEEKGDVVNRGEGETSNALFMSGHFVFPPSQHENLPLEPGKTEAISEHGGENDVSEFVEEGRKSNAKEEENLNIKKLTYADDFQEIPFLDEKDNSLAISDVDFAESTTLPGLNLAEKEQSIYGSSKFHSLRDEATMGASNIDDENSTLMGSLESSAFESDIPNSPKHHEEDNYDGSGLSYADWCKKQAASLYAHAKETNTFWSIFIAAAVMGLVIIGQQWRHERWQVLHHKLQFGINEQRMGRMMGPITRFKDAIVGGNRRGFSIRGSSSREH